MNKSWQCPYCYHHATITDKNTSGTDYSFFDGNKHKQTLNFQVESITCPNPTCGEYTIEAILRPSSTFKLLESWKLRPQSAAKPLPNYIPEAIKEDYKEACLILNLSPKASSTLARRCLQGMIRDFWIIKPQNLF